MVKKVDVNPNSIDSKFLLCLPLRGSLIVWGYFQVATNIMYIMIATLELAIRAAKQGFELPTTATLIWIWMIIWSEIDFMFCWFLCVGAEKKNANFLEISFFCLLVKLPLFFFGTMFIEIVRMNMDIEDWIRNCDSMTQYIFDNPLAFHVISLLYLYQIVMIQTMIKSLGKTMDFKSLYRRARKDWREMEKMDEVTEYIHDVDDLEKNIQESQKEEEEKRVIVC